MPESKNNAWKHGPARFQPPVFPGGMEFENGLLPVSAVINLEVGEEIVLYLKDSTPFISTLAKARPFNLRIHGGVARNQHGCLGFFVLWIPSPFNQRVPLAIYDLYLNPRSEAHLALWRELAFQTHWHLLLLDRKNEQRDFFEFANTFRVHEFLNEMLEYCQGIPILDFDKAKAEFIAAKSVEDLFELGPTASQTTESGLSIYDARFAIPGASDNANPLKSARYVRIVRESVARHSVGDRLPAAMHLARKLQALQSEVAKKEILYLDVCHWINLRHVWLQSKKALPVYEQIVASLKRLAERQLVLCPLSVPIFDELMKQLDPRSRAATANLMDIFSQGIAVMRFEDAFAQQCCGALTGEGHSVRFRRNSLSKIGLWFGDDQARAAWWTSDISESWENVSIDLRWAMTVCDAQRLAAQGFVPPLQQREFFSMWMGLPVHQKANPKPFWELSKKCRNDGVPSVDVRKVENAGNSAKSAG